MGVRLVVGVNDLATVNPALAARLVDPSRASTVSFCSGRKFDWWCRGTDVRPHPYFVWSAKVSNRKNGTDCPVCADRAVLVGWNDLATLQPELARQLVNLSDGLLVSAQSHRKLEWCCSGDEGKPHPSFVWLASPNSRVKGSGCPACSGRVAIPKWNDLPTVFPELAGHLVDPEDGIGVPSGSMRRLNWWCEGTDLSPHPHFVWAASPTDRARGRGCPACAGKAIILGWNDLGTTQPEIAARLKNPSDAIQFTAGSDRAAVWFCDGEQGVKHEPSSWLASPSSLVRGRGCPRCAATGYKDSRPGGCYLVSTDPADGLLTVEFGKANEESMEERLRLHAGSGLGTVHQIVVFEDGAAGTEFENLIIATMAEFGVPSCSDDGVKFDGSTEAFFLTEGSLDFARWLFAEFGTRLPYGWASSVLAAH